MPFRVPQSNPYEFNDSIYGSVAQETPNIPSFDDGGSQQYGLSLFFGKPFIVPENSFLRGFFLSPLGPSNLSPSNAKIIIGIQYLDEANC